MTFLLFNIHEEGGSRKHPALLPLVAYRQLSNALQHTSADPMLFRSHWSDQKTDAEYADDLLKFIGPHNNAKVIIDKSAASFKAEMLRRGIWNVDAEDDVSDGIRIVSMILNKRMVRFCRQTTPKTIQEMQTYAWDVKAVARGEEKPLKIHDHAPDAFRYFAKREVPWWRLEK